MKMMAANDKALILFICFMISQAAMAADTNLIGCYFDQIYQLGDSTADTGNYILETSNLTAFPCANPPYGETFFKKATGRCSDGILMIDYLAMAAGLPFLNPYKNIDADFRHGVNFAVAGATALPAHVLAAKNIPVTRSHSSLDVQLDWMFSHFNSICLDYDDCTRILKSALFVVGKIGPDDYSYPLLLQGRPVEEMKAMAPEVVDAIADGVRRVIKSGGVKIVVPGSFPIGCLPVFLTDFQTNNTAEYDEHHCLKRLNDLAIYHNDLLKQAIEDLKKEHPKIVIVYGDYYNAFLNLIRNAQNLGFDQGKLQKACCGTGGEYNFDITRTCGTAGVPVCPEPEKFISWDEAHMTQHGYQIMSDWVINDILPKLECH
ncbi:PREDICTED: acetylajmalan esterase-like [Ipomoea nil]|uniref:acetylajmalan esterase-like n=1 Tax=Ipomoea nil TaxID=35883 RepID=UPI000901EF15|nr:PREDICTED: acetylajmalan esterase-like [Ipomoea nil]